MDLTTLLTEFKNADQKRRDYIYSVALSHVQDSMLRGARGNVAPGHDYDDMVQVGMIRLFKLLEEFSPDHITTETYGPAELTKHFMLYFKRAVIDLNRRYVDTRSERGKVRTAKCKQQRKLLLADSLNFEIAPGLEKHEMVVDHRVNEPVHRLIVEEDFNRTVDSLRLTPELRQVFQLYYVDDFSDKEVAELLGITTIEARLLIQRVRHRICRHRAGKPPVKARARPSVIRPREKKTKSKKELGGAP